MLNVKSRDKMPLCLFLHRFVPGKLMVQGGILGSWLDSNGSLGLCGKEPTFLSVWAERRGQSWVLGSVLPQREGFSLSLLSAADWTAHHLQ